MPPAIVKVPEAVVFPSLSTENTSNPSLSRTLKAVAPALSDNWIAVPIKAFGSMAIKNSLFRSSTFREA